MLLGKEKGNAGKKEENKEVKKKIEKIEEKEIKNKGEEEKEWGNYVELRWGFMIDVVTEVHDYTVWTRIYLKLWNHKL